MAGITINTDPRIKRLCDQYGTSRVIAAALEVMRRRGRNLTAQSMENLLVCERAEFLPTHDGDVLVRLARGERKGFLHFEDDIARFSTRAKAEGFVRRYREDLVNERGRNA
jgi:hypothetical protein